jgi:hypothetical protein
MKINQEILQQKLPYPIKSVLTLGETVVTILSYDSIPSSEEEVLNRNVYGFNLDGTLKWQIQEVIGSSEKEKPFLYIKAVEDKLIAYNWIGMDYEVNLDDGSLCMYGQPRRPW